MHIFKVKPCDYSSVLQVPYRLYKTELWCFLRQAHYIWMQKGFIHSFWGKKIQWIITLPAKNIFFSPILFCDFC